MSQASGGQEALGPLVTLSERSWCTLGGWSTVIDGGAVPPRAGEERQQLKWFTYAAVLSVAVWLVFIVTGVVDRLPLALGIVIALAWLVAVPATIGVAMLRYRHMFAMFPITRTFRRAG